MGAPNDAGAGSGLPVAAAWHCENIGPRQRRRRIRTGLTLLAIGALVVGALCGFHANRFLRIIALVPFAAGSVTLFQVRARTCVVFAARKVKNMDHGEVPVTDARELAALTHQARLVWAQGIALGVALTIVAVALG